MKSGDVMSVVVDYRGAYVVTRNCRGISIKSRFPVSAQAHLKTDQANKTYFYLLFDTSCRNSFPTLLKA